MPSSLASIIIPVAPHHYAVVDDAIASACNQTYSVDVQVVYDSREQGAAWARNTGVAQSTAPFIVFLDADDTLAPGFLDETVGAWLASGGGNRYVYTDWQVGDTVRYANEGFHIIRDGMAHIITTLLPRLAFEAVGGFDETMRGGEDEDLYIRLHLAGLRVKRVAKPLVNYRIHLGASATNHQKNPHQETFVRNHYDRLQAKYGRYADMCCGSSTVATGQIANTYFEGAIEVQALYPPRHEVGLISGKKYPRVGHGATLWVDKRDYEAKPNLWKPLSPTAPIAPDLDTVLQLAQTAQKRTA
jgi:hypothetical protein